MIRATRSLRKKKLVEHELHVLVQIGQELIKAGTLELSDSMGQFVAAFTYDADYLSRARDGRAYALDPVNLPLRQAPFESTSRYFRLGALFDAAPDAWGRTVMAADAGVSPTALTESQVLLKGKGSGVGAIMFCVNEPYEPLLALGSQGHLPALSSLNDIYRTIYAIDTGAQVDPELREMLMSSWDIGGARPKVAVRDDNGGEWIVKFPRVIDTYSRQRVEWANLQMAKAIGLNVPDVQLQELDNGECALLVSRFDRTYDADNPQKINRHHYLSAVSLISPPADFDKRKMDTAFGASIFSYARIASVIRQISTDITTDLNELFGRMILNILVHNTDDHLKNTGFLLDPHARGYGYRLSPLFDVVTQEGTIKHMLHIGPGEKGEVLQGRVGTLDNALAGCQQWGLDNEVAKEMIGQVSEVVANRRYFYEQSGMLGPEIDQVERWVSKEIETATGQTIKITRQP